MHLITGTSADELFVKGANLLLEEGSIVSPRGEETLEVIGVLFQLADLANAVVELPERNISKKYLKAEFDWYLSGSLEAKDIAPYAKFWGSLADGNGKIASNYGYLALHQQFEGKSQLEHCIARLKRDPHTTEALIAYNQPSHDINAKDFPCALTQQFLLRNDRLHTYVVMRSNDLVWGLTYDLPWFAYLQQRVAAALDVKPGTYYHQANSLHVYKRHYSMLDRIAKASLHTASR